MQNKGRKHLHKYLRQEMNADEVMGHHAYGKVARSHRPIPKRRPSDDEKKNSVARYRDSMVGSIAQYREKVPTPEKPADTSNDTNSDTPVTGNRPRSGTVNNAKTTADPGERQRYFIEPPKRGYNPFG